MLDEQPKNAARRMSAFRCALALEDKADARGLMRCISAASASAQLIQKPLRGG
jgi:hypothetical protein